MSWSSDKGESALLVYDFPMENSNSDDALMAIAMNQDCTNADMTVARINLSREMKVAFLATEDYFAGISS